MTDFDSRLPDPADDRDEPTDDEISEAIDRCEPEDALTELMALTTDAEILTWARDYQQSIHDAIDLNREQQNSDGDE